MSLLTRYEHPSGGDGGLGDAWVSKDCAERLSGALVRATKRLSPSVFPLQRDAGLGASHCSQASGALLSVVGIARVLFSDPHEAREAFGEEIPEETHEGSAAPPATAAEPDRAGRVLYVVGIGASAGGLEAFNSSFPTCPRTTGMAFVLVQHLEPTHKGMMPELLRTANEDASRPGGRRMLVQPNCVYVIPPNADLAILHGKLQVLEPAAPRGLRTPIDFFFRQLAADQKEKAIGIILSGMGSDGTLGLRAIKEQLRHGDGARPCLGEV